MGQPQGYVLGVWRRVKGLLMPRRHYEGVEGLGGAVTAGMERLGEWMGQDVLQSLCVGTWITACPNQSHGPMDFILYFCFIALQQPASPAGQDVL